MDDNEFNARVEGNKIVANVIRGYQRQLAEAQAEVARLQTDADGLRDALAQAERATEAERAARIAAEAVVNVARKWIGAPAMRAALDAYDTALEGRA